MKKPPFLTVASMLLAGCGSSTGGEASDGGGGEVRSPRALPTGCSYDSGTVSCSGANITVSAFDFSLHNGLQLEIADGSSNITIKNNKFGVGSSGYLPRGAEFPHRVHSEPRHRVQARPDAGDELEYELLGVRKLHRLVRRHCRAQQRRAVLSRALSTVVTRHFG